MSIHGPAGGVAPRIWAPALALWLAVVAVLWALGVRMPAGLWVLTLAGLAAVCLFVSAVLFDRGGDL